MSTGITFSGFNDIDFNSVLNAMMTHAALPLNTLQGRQNALRTQLSTFDTLRGRIESVRTAADALGTMQSVSTMAAKSSHTSNLTVSSTSNAEPGHYDIVVSSLARAQVTASIETLPDADTTVVATGGTLTIGGVDVAIAGDTTLQGLADAINDTEDIGVTASVVRTGPTGFRLALQSNLTGTEHAFTVTNGLTGAALSFGANAVNAADAAITINNIASTSSSNTFENVVPGVTLTVLKADATTTVAVDVASDGSALATKVEAFVTAYNNIVSFLDTQRVAAGSGDAASIGSDPLLRQLRGGLRSQLLGAHGSESMTRLSEIGIQFTRDGRLELKKATFEAAVAADGDGVRQLLAGTEGAFPAIESMLESYTMTSGMISVVKDRLNKQISTMDQQILSMQNRLSLQRDALQRQFTEADAAMSRLKSQSSALSGIRSGF